MDAAGLQCSEVESDTSKQVFTGLQLNHEDWDIVVGSFSNLAVASWSGVATRQRHLTGDQVAKLLRRCPVTHQCWISFFHGPSDLVAGCGPRSPKSFDGLRDCYRFAIAILPVHGLRGSMLQMLLVEHHVAAELRVACVILEMCRAVEVFG